MNPSNPLISGLLPQFLLSDSRPSIPQNAFIAPGATVIGAATLGEHSSVWYGAVIRADINCIALGAFSNAQDGVVLHVSDDHACEVADHVTIGHRAVVHACRVREDVLVGMSATVLDGADIGPRCTIAAGSLVPKNFVAPEGSLILGSPARVVRALTLDEQKANHRLALKYVELARRYRELGIGYSRGH